MNRTTNVSIMNSVLSDNQRTMARIATYQEQLSSGKRINRISDDPIQARNTLRYRAESVRTDQFITNVDKGTSFLNTADDAFSSMAKIMADAKKIAIQGSNATQDSASRKSLATSLDSMLTRLIDVANTSQDGRYIFSGTDVLTKPFVRSEDGTNVTYNGNLDTFAIQVGPASSVSINQDGHTLFKGDVDVFKALSDIRDALKNNDPEKASALVADLDTASNHINNLHGALGGKETRLELANSQLTSAKTGLDELISKSEDVDYTKVISEFQMAQTALQAGLQSAAKVIRPSILDYL